MANIITLFGEALTKVLAFTKIQPRQPALATDDRQIVIKDTNSNQYTFSDDVRIRDIVNNYSENVGVAQSWGGVADNVHDALAELKNSSSLSGMTPDAGFSYRTGSSIVITPNSSQIIGFTIIGFDINGDYDGVDKFVVPTAGQYIVNSVVTIDKLPESRPDRDIELSIRLNGSLFEFVNSKSTIDSGGTNTYTETMVLSRMMDLGVGDELQILVENGNGANVNPVTLPTAKSSFEVLKIGNSVTTTGTGRVDVVVAGTDINVDSSNPEEPIVSVSSNVAVKDANNNFSVGQTINGTLGVTDVATFDDLVDAQVLRIKPSGAIQMRDTNAIYFDYQSGNVGLSYIQHESTGDFLEVYATNGLKIYNPTEITGSLEVTGSITGNIQAGTQVGLVGYDATGKLIVGSGGGSASPLSNKGDLYTYDTADVGLPVGTDGQILVADSSEPTGLKWIGNNTIGTKVLVQGGINSSQTVPSSTDTKIDFVDSVTGGFDVNGEWDNTNHKFVVGSSGAGTYQFMNSMFYPNNTGWSRLSIKKNGTPIDFYYGSGWENQSNSWEEPNGSWNIELAVGDEIEFWLYSTSGFSFNTTYKEQNCFQITKIGDSVTISTGVDSLTGGRDIALSGTATDPVIDHQTTSVVQTNVAILIPNSDTESMTCVNALGQTISISAPTYALGGANGRKFIYRFRSTGIHTLQWNGIGVNTGFSLMGVTLPTATKANKTLYIGCIYNGYTTRWDVVSVAEET